jgi:DNA/RNA-binding domain of Phe-tRNA-synthetase-like protein
MAVFGVAPEFVRVSIRLAGMDNGRNAIPAAALLARAGAAATAMPATGERWTAWREAYAAFGIGPDEPPPTAALVAWAAMPGGVPSLGPLSDLVNAFALQHALPGAAYDLAAVSGDLWLRPSRGIERYEPLDGGREASPPVGELILADSADLVLARHWHGAPGRATAVTATTSAAVVHFDLLPAAPERAAALAEAFMRLATGFVGGTAAVRYLTRAQPQAMWTP